MSRTGSVSPSSPLSPTPAEVHDHEDLPRAPTEEEKQHVYHDDSSVVSMSQDGPMCVICQDEISNRRDTMVRLSCSHVYHLGCMWIYSETQSTIDFQDVQAVSGEHWHRCPTCRMYTVPPVRRRNVVVYGPSRDGVTDDIPTPQPMSQHHGDEDDDEEDEDQDTIEQVMRAQQVLSALRSGTRSHQFVFNLQGTTHIYQCNHDNNGSHESHV